MSYNSDYMSRQMDKVLMQLEEMLTALYANATNKVTEQFTDYAKAFDTDAQKMRYLLEQGSITESEYYAWAQNKIFRQAAYHAAIKALTNTLVNTDTAAMAIVRGTLPFVIGQSYNFVQSLGWKAADEAGLSVGTFQIYNASAVQKLIKDNPRLLPKVNKPLDRVWNQDRINNVITQAIIQGDDIPTIAKKLQQVANMDKNTAIRTARTSMTYAENLGRDEAFERLKAQGIPVRKKWSAVIDGRTRDTHRQLNNTFANEQGLFGEGILQVLMRCPADPQGAAEEIYNCRCRLGIVFDKPLVDHSNDDEAYEEFLKQNYPDDYSKLKDQDYFNKHTTKPQGKQAKQQEKPPKQPKTAEKAKKEPVKGKETPINTKRSGVTETAESRGITPMPYSRLKGKLSDEEIIKKLAGGDMTKGSCVSVAYAYTGNKAGFDVVDFRGGESQSLFSSSRTIKQILNFEGVDAHTKDHTNDFTGAHAVLKQAKQGKQYILVAGKHAAIVKTDGTNYYYLDMQCSDSAENTWHKLTDEGLKYRFGCKKSHTFYGMKTERTSMLIDIDTLGKSPEFADVLKYINTKDQKKGGKGHAR